jgi:PTS system N-acetylglucosamine-specific IIC component
MKYLQKLGKALMLPVACLPICGILMGIGYLLCPASMQGGDITGVGPMIGIFLVKAGAALIDNMALLFVIGVGVGMSDDHDGTGGLAALDHNTVKHRICYNIVSIYRRQCRQNTGI